ncbi:nuclear transport factor 2 family protein [Aeromicrobium sp. 9AM]|uniref:nuclear transport factor 2 family protein n=1 Tax=Aeromicrobium sp. 9AM TaxID=2653126 RepID=UPI00135C077E|nr:nuclear transport factor 2 family protein [Aeromicrobium sp. 9AM]
MALSAAMLALSIVAVPSQASALQLPNPCGYTTPRSDSGAEVAAIKQLKANYFTNVDAKNWTGLRELLAPDVVADTSCSLGPIFFGRDPLIAFLKLSLGAAVTHHRGYDPKIELTSPTTATGLWTMDDVLVFAGTIGVHGYGHYSDRYVKVDGRWVVKHSKLTRTRFDLVDPNDGTTIIRANVSLTEVLALVNALTGG